jgi:hypothetical protein
MKLTSILLTLTIGTASVAQATQAQAHHHHSKYISQASSTACTFKVRDGGLVVKENLTQKQKDFLMVARFSSQAALDSYVVLNSIDNTFATCLKEGSEVPGFTKERKALLAFVYSSTKSKIIFVQGNQKRVIQGAIVVDVMYMKKNGGVTIKSRMTA